MAYKADVIKWATRFPTFQFLLMCVWSILKLYHNFIFPGLYSEFTACVAQQISEQISRNDAGGHLIKWAHCHRNIMKITPGKNWVMQLAWKSTIWFYSMQWFNHILVYYIVITIVNVPCERLSPFHNGQWLVWFVIMNKAYNNKHDVFCSFSFLQNVVNVEWVNEWVNEWISVRNLREG